MTTNAQFAHIWAQQTRPHGRNGNLFFEGTTIFSYGYHWPLATFLDSGTVLLNTDVYSSSTARHLSYVKRAISHKNRLECPHETIMRPLLAVHTSPHLANKKTVLANACAEAERYIREEVACKLAQAVKRRKQHLAYADINAAISLFHTYEKTFAYFGKKLSVSVRRLIEQLAKDYELVFEQQTRNAERKARKQQREYKKRVDAAIANFRANKQTTYTEDHLLMQAPVLLRIVDKSIQTSHGAKFPITHAKKVFPLIEHQRRIGKPWSATERKVTLRLGEYTIDNINAHGDVTAGCHHVKYEEINKLAQTLNLIPAPEHAA